MSLVDKLPKVKGRDRTIHIEPYGTYRVVPPISRNGCNECVADSDPGLCDAFDCAAYGKGPAILIEDTEEAALKYITKRMGV